MKFLHYIPLLTLLKLACIYTAKMIVCIGRCCFLLLLINNIVIHAIAFTPLTTFHRSGKNLCLKLLTLGAQKCIRV